MSACLLLTGCGGGDGSSSSYVSRTSKDCSPVTPGDPGSSGLISWPFVVPGDYTYDATKIRISGDIVSLALVDQTDDDNSSAGFGGGAHNSTVWDGADEWLELNPGDPPFDAAGDFTSRIIDAGTSTSWSSFSWTPQRPYYKEMPNNAQSETVYSEGNADMTGNVLLMHFNETIGTINDYSGNGNNGIIEYDVSYGADGMFNTALNFVSGRVYIASLNPVSTSDITITAWFKTTNGGTISALGGTSYPGLGVYGGYVEANNNQGTIYVSGASIVNDGNWHYAAAVIGNSGIVIYVDGKLDSPIGASFDSSGNNYAKIGLGTGYHWGAFYGTIDEVAFYNRALSDTEILDHYKRGAARLKFQVRTCDDAACDTEQFIGPDGTTATFFSELDNTTTGLPSISLTNVPDNRYFQYKGYLESSDISYTPELKDVIIGPAHYPGDSPAVINNMGPTYSSLNSFTDVLGSNNEGDVRYQISNNGTDWYYHNGTNWEPASGYAETNSASEINIYLWAFHSQVETGSFYFKAFFHSDTSQQVELDRLYLVYTN